MSDATVDLINLGSISGRALPPQLMTTVGQPTLRICRTIARGGHKDKVCRDRPRADQQQLFQINGMTAHVDVKQASRKPHRSHKLQIVLRPTSEHGSTLFSVRQADHVRCVHVAFETELGIVNWEAWVGIKA